MDRPLPPQILEAQRRAFAEPPSARRWRGTLLEQRGEIRLGPEKPWMPFTAEQRLDAARTGFVWHARVKMAPLVTCVVEDAYEDGQGRLDAKMLGVVPVARARGADVDRGEVQRYLAELVWCPSAWSLNPELHYRELPDGGVRVWTGDETTYVDLQFGESGDADGDIVAVSTTTRVRGDLGKPQDWQGRFFDYRDFEGVRAPSRGEVGWRTEDGLYLYWRGEVTSLRRSGDPAE